MLYSSIYWRFSLANISNYHQGW